MVDDTQSGIEFEGGSPYSNPFDAGAQRREVLKKVGLGGGVVAVLGAVFAGGYFAGGSGDQPAAEETVVAAPEEGASTGSPSAGDPFFEAGAAAGEEIIQRALEAGGSQETQARETVKLSVGGSVEVPCERYENDSPSCMTATLVDLDTNATCSYEGSDPGRYISVEIEASMPSDAPASFSTPFHSWSAATESGKWTTLSQSFCDLDRDADDLYGTFPGYSASGTFWFQVPEDASTLFMDYGRSALFEIDL